MYVEVIFQKCVGEKLGGKANVQQRRSSPSVRFVKPRNMSCHGFKNRGICQGVSSEASYWAPS